MEFKEELEKFINRIEHMKDNIQTEEATKMSLIVPFFQLLGYDVFNPSEFCPEYTADVGIKKGEKVDYAILFNNEPVILIEAKASNKKLDRHSSQLFRYFVTTSAKFAILTNGIIYKFYTDLDEANKMDKDPFMEINLLNIKDHQILQLSKFKRESLNINEILDTASLLKYNTIFKNFIELQILNPTDDFIKLFLQPVYKGAKTQAVIEKFRPIIKKALNDYIAETLNEKLKLALNNTTIASNNETENSVTSTEEWEVLSIVKELLNEVLDKNKIYLKRTDSYIAILYENNVRKWICRFILSNSQKILIIPDINKKEIRIPIAEINSLFEYKEQIIEVSKRYISPVSVPPKEVLYTRWGTYEMPSPYHLDLTRGPRKDLKKVHID